MTDSSEVYELLQIATLAEQWPELHPIRNRAMEKLRQIAKQPAHDPEPTPLPGGDKPTPGGPRSNSPPTRRA